MLKSMPASVSRLIENSTAHAPNNPSSRPATVPRPAITTRLEPDHPLDPLVGHADDAQQAELAATLEDRERERVDDPDQRDDHAHHQAGR